MFSRGSTTESLIAAIQTVTSAAAGWPGWHDAANGTLYMCPAAGALYGFKPWAK